MNRDQIQICKDILKNKVCLNVFRSYLCVKISYLHHLMVEACSNVFDHASNWEFGNLYELWWKYCIQKVSRILFVAVTRTSRFSHITSHIIDLHWLPVWIDFKLVVFARFQMSPNWTSSLLSLRFNLFFYFTHKAQQPLKQLTYIWFDRKVHKSKRLFDSSRNTIIKQEILVQFTLKGKYSLLWFNFDVISLRSNIIFLRKNTIFLKTRKQKL